MSINWHTKKRKILLIEPGYKNKYPPIGLMKIATYHRMLGDDVIFHKGDIKELILEDIFEKTFQIWKWYWHGSLYKAIGSYNGGYRWNRRYARAVLDKIRFLKKHIVIK